MAKQKILKRLFGTHEESFQNPLRMLLAIKYSNPKTIIIQDYKMVDDDKTMFGRAFQVFGTLIDKFQQCYHLINIDDTHLYDKYKEKLLVAVAYDVNNGVYSLCFIIFEEKTTILKISFQICFIDI